MEKVIVNCLIFFWPCRGQKGSYNYFCGKLGVLIAFEVGKRGQFKFLKQSDTKECFM